MALRRAPIRSMYRINKPTIPVLKFSTCYPFLDVLGDDVLGNLPDDQRRDIICSLIKGHEHKLDIQNTAIIRNYHKHNKINKKEHYFDDRVRLAYICGGRPTIRRKVVISKLGGKEEETLGYEQDNRSRWKEPVFLEFGKAMVKVKREFHEARVETEDVSIGLFRGN